jgi:hypothetical protein
MTMSGAYLQNVLVPYVGFWHNVNFFSYYPYFSLMAKTFLNFEHFTSCKFFHFEKLPYDTGISSDFFSIYILYVFHYLDII